MSTDELKAFIIERLNYHENECGEINRIDPGDYEIIADEIIAKLETMKL